LKGQGKSYALINGDINSISSFFNFVQRRNPQCIQNPVRGTKLRVMKDPKEQFIPTTEEALIAIGECEGTEMAVILRVCLENGLRASAFPLMAINGNRYKSYSKGKDISGELSEAVLAGLRVAKLRNVVKPFTTLTANAIELRVNRLTEKLYREKKIRYPFSIHKLRSLFAINFYNDCKDIYKTSRALSHKSIQTTQIYLSKNLGILDC
jgi:integrase